MMIILNDNVEDLLVVGVIYNYNGLESSVWASPTNIKMQWNRTI